MDENVMKTYLADHTITVFPFTQKPDGEETIIANAAHTAFLSLPTEAIDILHWLKEGKTVGEAQALYHEKYQELPDMDSFLELMESEGFITSNKAEQLDESGRHQIDSLSLSQARPRLRRQNAHFTFISEKLAKRIVCRPVLWFCVLCIVTGFLLVVIDPSLVPPPTVLVFKQNLTLMTIGFLLQVFPAI